MFLQIKKYILRNKWNIHVKAGFRSSKSFFCREFVRERNKGREKERIGDEEEEEDGRRKKERKGKANQEKEKLECVIVNVHSLRLRLLSSLSTSNFFLF